MFGHDNQSHHDDNAHSQPEPTSDGVLDANEGTVTAPTMTHDDHTAPTVSDNSSTFLVTSNGAPESAAAPAPADTDTLSPSGADDLIAIKQKALHELSPLVGHLDQSPEEKFRTTMMMIQASDDQSLIKDAYAAAQSITDEKVKAQALLDIVNEINYFTQQQTS